MSPFPPSRPFVAVLFVLLLAPTAWAQDDDILDVPLDDDFTHTEAPAHAIELSTIHVEGSGDDDDYLHDAPFTQTVAPLPTLSLNDWLEQTPGVFGDVSSKGERFIMVRGFTTRQISARFDDIPLDTGYDNITGLDAIPMNWIGRGELQFADVQASDAIGLGGGLAMFSTDPKWIEAAFETNFTGGRFSLAHGMNLGPYTWAITAGAHYSNGFRLSHAYKPNPYENGGIRDASKNHGANALAKIARTLGSWGNLELMGGYTYAPREVPTGVNTGYDRYWDFTDFHIAMASAKLSWNTPMLTGSWRLWFDEQGNTLRVFDTPARNTQTSAIANDSIWCDREAGTLFHIAANPFDIGLGMLDVGFRAELRYQHHASVEKRIITHAQTDKSADRLTFDLRPSASWQIIPALFLSASAFAVGDIELTRSDSSQTLEHDRQQLYNGGFTLGLQYAPLSNLKIALHAARRLRMPTLKEQFNRVTGAFGLNAEVAWHVQLQIDYTPIPTLAFQLIGHDSEIRDLINFRYTSGIKEAYNVDSARIAGLDAILRIGPFWGLSLDLAYAFLHARDLQNDKTLTDRPQHSLRATLRYAPIFPLTLSLGLQYESKRRTESWIGAQSAWMGDITLLNAQIEYKTPQFSVYLRGANLLDFDYARAYGYPEPGFQATLGAKIALDTP